jgi:hypothetical protein
MSRRWEKRDQKWEEKMTATARARLMLIDAAGPRGWSDTREAWIARGARYLGISYRRAKKLFYEEPIKLGADEYFNIERAWQSATRAMAASSEMARASAAIASSAALHRDSASLRDAAGRLRDRAAALGAERRGPAKDVAGD